MTRLGKCETCRNRKVKCDEQRPICGVCKKTSRPCFYASEKISGDRSLAERVLTFRVAAAGHRPSGVQTESGSLLCFRDDQATGGLDKLGVQHARQAEDGDGTFLTLGASRTHKLKRSRQPRSKVAETSNLTPAIRCQQTKSSAEWARLFGYDALDINPLGDYLKSALIYAPEHEALGLASRYALDSLSALGGHAESSLMQAHKTGSRALRALKTAVDTCSSTDDMRNLNLAILLHFAAEHFIQLGSFNYVPHILAARHMLRLYRTRQGSTALIREIAHSLSMDESMECMMNGLECSVFEGVFEPNLGNKSAPNRLDVAADTVGSLLVSLPRLVYRVREATQPDSKAEQRALATKVALEIFNSADDDYVRETIEAHSSRITCLDEDTKHLFDMVFDFTDQKAFLIAAHYYVHRIILSGILQRICTRGGCPDTKLDITRFEQADTDAATSAAMCLHYAMQPRPSRPFTALKILFPLQMAVGTWVRLLRRQQSPDTTETIRATAFIDWTYDKLDEIGGFWRYRSGRLDSLSRVCDMFAGGPFCANRARPVGE